MVDARFTLYFAEDYGDEAPEGPGWYLFGTATDADGPMTVLPRIRISGKQATVLAKVVDKQVEGKPFNWPVIPGLRRGDVGFEPVVVAMNERAKEVVAAKVAEAEELAQKIEQLRARAQEFES